MDTKYMFDKHDITKYQFLKKFIAEKNFTIVPMRTKNKKEIPKNQKIDETIKEKIIKAKNEIDLKINEVWQTYYNEVKKCFDLNFVEGLDSKQKEPSEVVFLDPDTGIDKKSKKSEHLLIDEIEKLVKLKKTIIIYQHGDRTKGEFEDRVKNKLHSLNQYLKKEKIAAYHVGKDIYFIVILPESSKFPKVDGFSIIK